MRDILRKIVMLSVVFSLTAAPITAFAVPAPPTQAERQKAAAAKAKEAEKRKKEAEKAKKAKEKQKAAQAKQKEANAQQAAREKAAAERQKAAAERLKSQEERAAAEQAREEKAKQEYEKYLEEQENPKTELISLFNIGARLGYAALIDKMNGQYMGAGTLDQHSASQQVKGGFGAGIDATYGLEYGHFRFETGLDFRFLNSASNYGFTAQRLDKTYGATYLYLFDNLREARNIFQIGVPVMFGAQFSRYYFLLGAKFHYTLMGNYSHAGQYDIVVNDPSLLEPYGLGIHTLNGQTDAPMRFAVPDLSLAAEIGIDLDEWLQKQPDKKKRANTKPGERLPFGREHVHYRAALFAEYSVLNHNATPKADPVTFAADNAYVQKTNTLLAMNGDTKLNNLFVGAKFIVQFEVPGKKARPVAPPASYAIYSVVDAKTNQPLANAYAETRETATGKVVMHDKKIGAKGLRQKHQPGAYSVDVTADGYYKATQSFDITEHGETQYVTIAIRPCPVFRARVTNAETGALVPATIQIFAQGADEPAFSLATDTVNGTVRQLLNENSAYRLVIAQMGYEAVERPIYNVGDSMNIALRPIKKGEKFVIKNLFFATNKTQILSISEQSLNDLFQYLDRNPEVRIRIIGHTDNVGRDDANKKLSEGRAKAVRANLIERGIAPERLQAEGRGESQPIDTNDTEEGRQNNRRVEIEIL